MANVTVTTSNPSITVDSTNSIITVSQTTSNVTVGEISPASVPSNLITSIGTFGTLNVGNATTTQYTFPIDAPSVDAGLKAYANGTLYWSTDVGLVDSVNGQTGDVVLTTTHINEGTNLYYTNARVLAYIQDNGLDFNAEKVDDRVANLMVASGNLSYTYDDANGTLTLSQSLTTDDIAEGTNLYYTQGRFDTAFSGKTTTDLTEGSNLYWTTARGNTNSDAWIATKDTGDLAEGTNLYWTTDRGNTNSDAWIATKDTGDLAEGSNLYWTTARGNAAMDAYLVGGNGLVYSGGTFWVGAGTGITTGADTVSVNMGDFDTGDLAEGSNLYWTTDRGNTNTQSYLQNNDIVIGGNLTVQGSQTIIESNLTATYDNIFRVNSDGDSLDSGFEANVGGVIKQILYDVSESEWTFGSENVNAGTFTGELTGNVTGNVNGDLTGDVTGNVTGQVSDISNHTTTDLTEGTNLYYTTDRANAAMDAYLSVTDNSTDNDSSLTLSSGVFTYTGQSTGNIRGKFSGGTGISYNSSTGEISLSDTDLISGVTAGAGLTGGGDTGNVTLDIGAGNGITVNADNVAVDMSVFSTSDLAEGTNLYWTTDRGNATINAYTGSFTNLTGDITTTANVSGANFNGNVVGDITGDVTGNVTATTVDVSDTLTVDTIDNRTGQNVTISANVIVGQNPTGQYAISNTYSTVAITSVISALNKGFGTDTITLSGHSSQVFSNGTYIEISGIVDSGFTELNGNVYYTQWNSFESGYDLYKDAALTTGATDCTGSSYLGSPSGSPIVSYVTGSSNTEILAYANLYVSGHVHSSNVTNTGDITSTTFTGTHIGNVSGPVLSATTSVNTNTINPYSGSTVTVNGDLEVAGNVNYVNVEDVQVEDNKITLNYGNAAAQDAFIYVDRSGSSLANTFIKWNETDDRFEIDPQGGEILLHDAVKLNNKLYLADINTNAVSPAYLGVGQTVLGGGLYTNEHGITLNNDWVTEGDVNAGLGVIKGNGAGVYLLWNSSTNRWTFTNDGSTYHNLHTGSTDDIEADVISANNFVSLVDNSEIFLRGNNLGLTQTGLVGNGSIANGGGNISAQHWGDIEWEGFQPTALFNTSWTSGNVIPTAYVFVGNSTAGSNVYTVTGFATSEQYFSGNTSVNTTAGDIQTAIADVQIGSIVTQEAEPIGAKGQSGWIEQLTYVTGTDSANSTITFNANATTTVTAGTSNIKSGEGLFTSAGLYNTQTGTRLALLSAKDINTGANTAQGYFAVVNSNTKGFTASPDITDLTLSGGITYADFTQTFNRAFNGRSYWTVSNPNGDASINSVFRAKDGIVVGRDTEMSNRPFQDQNRSFGINVGFDGKYDSITQYNIAPITQVGIGQHNRHSAANSQQDLSAVAGPRLIFSTFDGDVSTPLGEQYPKDGMEMGRVMSWGRSQNTSNPTSFYNVSKLAWYARDFTGTNTKTDVVLTAGNGVQGAPVLLTGKQEGVDTTHVQGHKAVYLGPTLGVDQVSAGDNQTKQKWFQTSYIDQANSTGSLAVVTNGYNPNANVDIELGIDRKNSSSNVVIQTNRGGVYSWPYSDADQTAINFYGYFSLGYPADGIRFQSISKLDTIPGDFVDGTPVTLNGFTGTFGSTVNGNTYYGRKVFNVILLLYTDAALTTGLNTGVATGTNVDSDETGTVSIDVSGAWATKGAAKRYSWFMPSDSNDIIHYLDGSSGTELYRYDHANSTFVYSKDISTTNPITTTGNISASTITATDQFVGDIDGAVLQQAYNNTAGTLNKGEVVYITNAYTGDNPHIELADADDPAKMPAMGIVYENISPSSVGKVVISGELTGINTTGFATGDDLYVDTTAGALTNSAPTGESSGIQKVGKVIKGGVSGGAIIVTGAYRTNAVSNLNNGNIFIGNGSNQAVTALLDTSIVPENTNLYYTDARVDAEIQANVTGGYGITFNADNSIEVTNVEIQAQANIAIGNNTTDALTEGSTNLYYTDARVDSRLASGSVASFTADDVTLKQFQETKIAYGNRSGDISSVLDLSSGSIFTVTATGALTINSVANAVSGSSGVIIITQDGTGTRTLTTGANIKWAGGLNTLSTAPGEIDIINFFYDGSTYYFALSKGYV